jgi:hypothetical protein
MENPYFHFIVLINAFSLRSGFVFGKDGFFLFVREHRIHEKLQCSPDKRFPPRPSRLI